MQYNNCKLSSVVYSSSVLTLFHIIKFVLFTKLNIIVSLSECLNVVSNFDIKNKKILKEKKELCEISVLVNIQLLLNFWENYLCMLFS